VNFWGVIGMNRKIMISFMVFVGAALLLPAAEYKGRRVDGQHVSALIHIENDSNCYDVDLVFVGKAVNIAFPEGISSVFRSTLLNGKYLTLYLYDEKIEDPANIKAKQVSPPTDLDARSVQNNPEDWPASQIWIMKVEMK
jgi:hypothetical protein